MIKCCLNCNNRQIGCHSICQEYITQQAEFKKSKADYMSKSETEVFLRGRGRRWRDVPQRLKPMESAVLR